MARFVITLLFCFETFSRGLLLAIIPLKVLSFVGSMQGVALFYAAVAIVGLGNSILVPMLLSRFGSRAVVTAAGFLIICGVALLTADTLAGMAFGLGIRVLAQSFVEISMMAYIMARVPRSQLGQFEPIRIFFQGAALAISPWLGFYLRDHVSPSSPFYAAAAGGGIILCLAMIALPTFRPAAKTNFARSPNRDIPPFLFAATAAGRVAAGIGS